MEIDLFKEVSADNRLSLAKSLVTTGCHQQKVCWQPAVFSNTTVYLAIYLSLVAFTVIEILNKYWIRKLWIYLQFGILLQKNSLQM